MPDVVGAVTAEGRRHWRDYLRALGPGLISGASDNDPTTVATLAVLGASTGYGLSWLVILIYPMLATVQIISAQVGVVAKRGLQRAIRLRYGRRWGLVLLVSVLVVNLITLGADLEGGAAALGLIFHVAWQWFVIPFAIGMLLVLFFGNYESLERVLQYVLLVFAAYIISAFLARPDWGAVLHQTVMPPISFNHTYVEGALALLGTTLTSYAYVWETIEEAEERKELSDLGLARADAGFGMLFAVAIFWFILIGTGATLGKHHQQIQTAQQAAAALRPLAGPVAADLFAVGLLASSILAVPILAATTAYIVGSEFGWGRGLSERFAVARPFYATIAVSVILGVVIAFAGVSPIQLLYISGIFGGLATPISLIFLLIVARDHQVMGDNSVNVLLAAAGWITAILISAISLFFLWQQFG